MSSIVINENNSLPPEAIIAKMLLSPKVSGKLHMSQIAELIAELGDKGINTSRILCYPIGSTIHCDDLDSFVSRFVKLGRATDSSPVTLNAKGIESCEKIIEKVSGSKKVELEKLQKILDEL